MDDLRSRFNSLERVPMPNLWPDIELRAQAHATSGTVARVIGRQTTVRGTPLTSPLGRRSGLSLSWAVALGLLLVTAIAAGGLVTGAWRIDDLRPPVLPAVSPEVSPAVSPEVSPAVSPEVSPAASPAVSPAASPAASPSLSAPTQLRCSPHPTGYRSKSVVIEDETGLVTSCRIVDGLPAEGAWDRTTVLISNPPSSTRRLQAGWAIGCEDSDEWEVRIAAGVESYMVSVHGRQEHRCWGTTWITVELELARSVLADDVTGAVTRTPRPYRPELPEERL